MGSPLEKFMESFCRATYDRIELGMTSFEVSELLFPPTRRKRGMGRTLSMLPPNGTVSVWRGGGAAHVASGDPPTGSPYIRLSFRNDVLVDKSYRD